MWRGAFCPGPGLATAWERSREPALIRNLKAHHSNVPLHLPSTNILYTLLTNTQDSTNDMTRSHKYNDRDHRGEHGENDADQHLPRYFAKSGPVDADPKGVKKNGGGKGNWGRDGDEIEDYKYNMTNPRRRSNSFSHGATTAKTKFETVEPEPVFEEDIHGPVGEDGQSHDLERESTGGSSASGSVEEEEAAAGEKKM